MLTCYSDKSKITHCSIDVLHNVLAAVPSLWIGVEFNETSASFNWADGSQENVYGKLSSMGYILYFSASVSIYRPIFSGLANKGSKPPNHSTAMPFDMKHQYGELSTSSSYIIRACFLGNQF